VATNPQLSSCISHWEYTQNYQDFKQIPSDVSQNSPNKAALKVLKASAPSRQLNARIGVNKTLLDCELGKETTNQRLFKLKEQQYLLGQFISPINNKTCSGRVDSDNDTARSRGQIPKSCEFNYKQKVLKWSFGRFDMSSKETGTLVTDRCFSRTLCSPPVPMDSTLTCRKTKRGRIQGQGLAISKRTDVVGGVSSPLLLTPPPPPLLTQRESRGKQCGGVWLRWRGRTAASDYKWERSIIRHACNELPEDEKRIHAHARSQQQKGAGLKHAMRFWWHAVWTSYKKLKHGCVDNGVSST